LPVQLRSVRASISCAGRASKCFSGAIVPSAPVFKRVVGGIIEQTLRGRDRTPVRAYGEMVDVLWKQGETNAAVRLEVLWNDLAGTQVFSLLCGYAIGSFYNQTQQYEEVCNLHTQVHESEHRILPFDPDRARKTA